MEHSLFSACRFRRKCDNWREAIKYACLPLERQGVISVDYAQAIITATERYGAWYILSPEFALPHARPEQGVISQETHLSLLCLGDAVCFPDHPDVRLVIVLAAADSTRHVTMIQQLLCWLDEGERLKRLSSIDSPARFHSVEI